MAEIDIKKQIENYTKLNKRLAQYSSEIQRIFQMLNTEGCQLALSTTPALKNLDKIFRFADYPQTKAGVEKLLKKYTKELQTLIISGMEAEYTKGDETQTILGENIVNRCNSALPEDKQIPLDKAKLGIVTSSTDLAVKSFTEKRLKNFNLRSVLALQSVKYKDELECAISTALTKGTSARELAKQVTTLFRDHAKFEAQYLEKFGEKLNTGKTLYEAMRLARTEINMAYRDAEQSRWGDMPFILGYEIRLSNNHNCKGIPKGKFYDICDELEGKYPKDFKWLGWHPNCRCHAIPILMSDDQFIQWNNGKQVNAPTIDKMPEKFDKWLKQNAERIERATQRGTLPYFLRDNGNILNSRRTSSKLFVDNHYFHDKLNTSLSGIREKLSPTPIENTEVIEEFFGNVISNDRKLNASFGGFAFTSSEFTFMSSSVEDKIITINFADSKNGFNAGKCLVSAVENIKKGQKLNFNEEYAIECLWHELLHNISKNSTKLPLINSPQGFTRAMVETANQLVARHTYDSFMKKFNILPLHKDNILENGYSYSDTVTNLRKLLKKANIDENKFAQRARRLLMKDYADFDEKLFDELSKLYNEKSHQQTLKLVYLRLEMKEFLDILKILP